LATVKEILVVAAMVAAVTVVMVAAVIRTVNGELIVYYSLTRVATSSAFSPFSRFSPFFHFFE
jgi:hypothetical protein